MPGRAEYVIYGGTKSVTSSMSVLVCPMSEKLIAPVDPAIRWYENESSHACCESHNIHGYLGAILLLRVLNLARTNGPCGKIKLLKYNDCDHYLGTVI